MYDLREDVVLYHKGCIVLLQAMIRSSIKSCIALKLNCKKHLRRNGYKFDEISSLNVRKLSYYQELNFLKNCVIEYDKLEKILKTITWKNDSCIPSDDFWVDKYYEQYFRKYRKLS